MSKPVYELWLSPTSTIDDAPRWQGACSCGTWTSRLQRTRWLIRAQWNDHVHLNHEHQCAIHGYSA